MKYKCSRVDLDNFKWFANDMSRATLGEITLVHGQLRGLHPFHIEFTYPISIIAGKNGSGKSTILAMAACAFHNGQNGFRLPDRKLPYYTFSDFFIQVAEEIPPGGIFIRYRIRHDNWKKSPRAPDGCGYHYQIRRKTTGGKWNRYSNRVRRDVVFLGIQRVVPHSEKTVSRSYRAYFAEGAKTGWEDDTKKAVGRVLGLSYDAFNIKTFGKYHMPLVLTRGNKYSGFNMGAGENTLFEIFSIIYSCPPGALLVIDEIELGLHEDAQRRLITELKDLCKERHIQVVCTTHSPAILEAVPPEARFFVESYATNTVITEGISPQYAAGKLAGRNLFELDIYVEDGIAKHVAEAVMPCETRKRVSIMPIGSASAVLRQMAARYKDRKTSECLAVLDGDQSTMLDSHIGLFLAALESCPDAEAAKEWLKQRLVFLPGSIWPEQWIIQELKNSDLTQLADTFQTTKEVLDIEIEKAGVAGKHSEMYSLAQSMSLDEQYVCFEVCNWIATAKPDEFADMKHVVEKLIK